MEEDHFWHWHVLQHYYVKSKAPPTAVKATVSRAIIRLKGARAVAQEQAVHERDNHSAELVLTEYDCYHLVTVDEVIVIQVLPCNRTECRNKSVAYAH